MSKEMLVAHNIPLDKALDCTKQLFTNEESSIETISVKEHLLGTVSYMAATAFTADKTPEKVAGTSEGLTHNAIGVQEHTINGTTVTHLNKNKLKGVLGSVLKIDKMSLSSIVDKDNGIRVKWLGQKEDLSDPFVVFRQGVSMSITKAFEDSDRVDFGSETHYLFIRKKEKTMVKEENDKLNIYVFDRDNRSMDQQSSLQKIRAGSELLGSTSRKLKELKEDQDGMIIVGFGDDNSMTLKFRCQFLSFEEYCEEQGKADDSNWLQKATFDVSSKEMFDEVESFNLNPSDPPLPLLYFYNKDTSTQGWIHMCAVQKVLLVSFKGTGSEDNFRDIWTDLNWKLTTLKGTDIDEYKFDSSESLEQTSGTVHTGFREAYVSIRDIMLETLHTVSLWRTNWLFVFTGHSLGGALATLAAYEVANRKLDGSRPKVAMINFGCPRLASPEFREKYDGIVDVSYRFCAPHDIVPCLPSHLEHVGREVRKNKDDELIVEKLKHEEMHTNDSDESKKHFLQNIEEMFQQRKSRISSHFKPSYFASISEAGRKLREWNHKK